MKRDGGIYREYEKELLRVCKSTVKITDKYQKALDAKKDRSTSVSEYYAFSKKLSECVELANQTAKKLSELILEADKRNDFEAKEVLNKLLGAYIYYRTYVETFLKTAECAKSTNDFIRVLNYESDVLARKIIAISRDF